MRPLEHPASDAILLNPDDETLLMNAWEEGLNRQMLLEDHLRAADKGRLPIAVDYNNTKRRTDAIGSRLRELGAL